MERINEIEIRKIGKLRENRNKRNKYIEMENKKEKMKDPRE
jgi:hypothetical protein